MSLKIGTALALSGSLVAFAAMAQDASEQSTTPQFGISAEMSDYVRDKYIFVFSDRMKKKNVAAEARRMARRMGAEIVHVYDTAIRGFAARMPAAVAAKMAEDPMIDYYEPDGVAFVTMNRSGGEFTAQAQTTPWGITRVGGPGDGTNLGLYAFVIDTGIDLDHPDLNVATSLSRSFVTGLSSPDDQNGHGTHVAGTIAAKNDGNGVVGVAAGARVVAVRVLNAQGSGSFSDIIAGVNYVAQVGLAGEVANMSLGGPRSTTLDNAVRNAAARGIFFSIAAGNSSVSATTTSPARVNATNVYTVSAMDINDELASFSNFGNPPIDCADPGVSVLSTWPGGGTATLSGTSMAAPHLAGILLLNNGQAFHGGTVSWDKDSTPDIICVR